MGNSIFLFIGISALVFNLYVNLFPYIKNYYLQKTGYPALAKVISVSDTAISINRNPQVKLTLELKDKRGETYQTECRAVVSRLTPGVFQPGMQVPVKVATWNKNILVIDGKADNSMK